MIPKVSRGQKMAGLMVYLAGEGRHNEHTEQHLVAGDPAIMAWHDDAELDRSAALAIAQQLEAPSKAFGVDMADGSVFHVSLSLAAREGLQTDQTWAAIAQDYVDAMGFTNTGSGKADCRWVAVRHGVSSNRNDHIHIAVHLVREDGTKEHAYQSYRRSQKICGELEAKYGLEILESRQNDRGSPGLHQAEIATAARRNEPEPARTALARAVRGCATAAADEAEFVRRLRRAGVLVRPRFAAGREDVVAGYSVAIRAPAGQRPIWYGGGHLGKDLTLPRLRGSWPDTPQQAGEAAAEWAAGRRNRRVVAPGREAREIDPQLWAACTSEVAALRERLRSVPVDDRSTWAHVARETAGAFAAWSLQVEATPGPLAATADSLARSARLRSGEIRVRPAEMPSAKGAALLLSSLAHGGRGPVAEAALLVQLANTAKALYDAHVAAGEAQRAAQIAYTVRTQLSVVGAGLSALNDQAGRQGDTSEADTLDPVIAQAGIDAEAAQAARLAGVGQVPLRAVGSPVPADLHSASRAHVASAGREPDQENGPQR